MRGITLRELYEIRNGTPEYWKKGRAEQIVEFASIYTDFDNFNDALNYVIAVISKDKTYMPSVTVGKE
jgi:hypothetical protein